MWAVENFTPFAAERSWVRAKNGAEVWLVAVKGTFDIDDNGNLSLADKQEPVNIAPKLREGSDAPSLLCDTDLPHRKFRTDVLVDGHAHVPGGREATKLQVRLRVANIDKTLSVVGDRIWRESTSGVVMSPPKPFVKMPLIYERSFGGKDELSDNERLHDWESRNLAGRGFYTTAENIKGKFAPNVEDPKSLIQAWNDRPSPVGFGPIAGHWSPRVELAGTYDDTWKTSRSPLLPEDFDDSYHQCAPIDQQVPNFLKGGEVVELSNMTPSGHLKFRLPRVSLALSTKFDDGTSVVSRPAIHTVTIMPDFPKILVTWHMNHECHYKVLKLNTTTVRLKERIMLSDRDRLAVVST